MGLIVTAYKSVVLVNAMTVQERNAVDMEESGRDVFLHQDGKRPQSDGMADGIYRFTGKPKRHDAGGYAAYSAWRDALSRMALNVSAEDVWAGKREGAAFVELINFSDCEGFIGPKTSAKLAAGFSTFADKANGSDKAFRAEYAAFRHAFEYASNGGVVKFH